MTSTANDILLTVEGVSKHYPGVAALSEVRFELRAGEVHALVGENGAGKSTLGRILSGLEAPDAGSMTLAGLPYSPAGKVAAEQLGVRMVMQELNLIVTLSAAENIFLRHLPNRLGWIDYRRLRAAAAGLMEQVGLGGVDPDCPVGELGVGQQQMVEIAAGLSRQCRVLILDEPTAALTDTETDLLFARIRGLRAKGVGVVYVSHRMEEIRRIADRITVLRNGRHVATCPAPEADMAQVIRWMVGRDLDSAAPTRRTPPGPCALSVRGLSRAGAISGVSFDLRGGEILGLAGLMGSGRTETLRAIFGADRPDAGEVFLAGSGRPARIRGPRDAVKQGIALLTEDRKGQGLLLPLSVRVNVTLASLSRLARRGGFVHAAAERDAGLRLARQVGVGCRDIEQAVDELSGGNQQKVILARWLLHDAKVLLFDEPTRGIDVGAKFEIYRLLDDLAERGKALLVVSSDLQELQAICDRIAVMSAGRLVQVFDRGRWSQDRILAAALSGYAAPAEKEAAS